MNPVVITNQRTDSQKPEDRNSSALQKRIDSQRKNKKKNEQERTAKQEVKYQ